MWHAPTSPRVQRTEAAARATLHEDLGTASRFSQMSRGETDPELLGASSLGADESLSKTTPGSIQTSRSGRQDEITVYWT